MKYYLHKNRLDVCGDPHLQMAPQEYLEDWAPIYPMNAVPEGYENWPDTAANFFIGYPRSIPPYEVTDPLLKPQAILFKPDATDWEQQELSSVVVFGVNPIESKDLWALYEKLQELDDTYNWTLARLQKYDNHEIWSPVFMRIQATGL